LHDEKPFSKSQLSHRLPADFIQRTLADFNARLLSAQEACALLSIGKTRLYSLRWRWLKERAALLSAPSGGNHLAPWPPAVLTFLHEFLPLQSPPNYQLIADELLRQHRFSRSRSCIRRFVKKHLAHLIPAPQPRPRHYRRFRRARFGELWQHDSSPHQWWPAPGKQTLLLTVDDHSGLIIAGRFVPGDTTWNHFCHFRAAFETYGLPQAIYTDGLSLFGPSCRYDTQEPKSQFQRALKALGIAHLVAPTPQAKGKIERRFATFQNRMIALLAHAKADSFERAQRVLQMEIARQNSKTLASTGLVPQKVFEDAKACGTLLTRPTPDPSLLDLHLSLRAQRKVYNDNTIEFDGHTLQIAPTARKSVTALFHPGSQLWLLEEPPTQRWPTVLAHFSL